MRLIQLVQRGAQKGPRLAARIQGTIVAGPVHAHGRALRGLIDNARDEVAALAGATAQKVVFTGSATEAITQAIVGSVAALGIEGIVVSAGEHAAVSKAESIRKFVVLPAEWTEEGGQLTPSLKLKRNVVMREFRSEVESIYL